MCDVLTGSDEREIEKVCCPDELQAGVICVAVYVVTMRSASISAASRRFAFCLS